ncbi:MAG: hypothetical protein ACRDJP_11375, partial [Actinomycetota bacterium]
MTSPNTAVALEVGSTQPVTWDVAGTDASPISAATVDILLSTDGGATFPTTLEPETPNDGSEDVVLPNVSTSEARIKIQPTNNVFFDVSNEDFTIANAPVATNDAPGDLSTIHGQPLPTTVTVSASDPDSQGSELSATPTGLPDGMELTEDFTTPGAALPGIRTWTVTGNADDAAGTYPVSVEVRDGGLTDTTQFTIEVTKADQTIDFEPLPNKAYGDPDFDVSATATSGLPVSFVVGSGDECMISGNTVHLTGPGSCTVTASQPGDDTYNAATNVARTFAILQPDPTDLSVSSSPSSGGVEVGRSLTYTVVVRNDGPGSGAEVNLTQRLPASTLLLEPSTARADGCTRAGDQLTCDVGLLET